MINAGVAIKPFNGEQVYNDISGQWENVTVTVNYPADQNPTENPVTPGDVIIEPNNTLWEVTSVVLQTDRDFKLNVVVRDGETTADVSPQMGQVDRGSITTPVNGQIAPYWDAVIVSSETGRIASMANVKQGLWSGPVDLGRLGS